jgi:hypothetical protein
MRKSAISFALVFLSATIAFGQSLTIVSRVTRDGGAPTTTTSYISGDHARWSSGEGGDVIIDAKSGQMTILDARKKTYYVMTRQDIDAAAAKMQEQMNSPEMKKSQEAMKNLTPEQRKRMEAAMGSMFSVNVEKLGTSRKIAGYNCDDWTMTIGQMSTTVECVTSEVKFPTQAWDMYKGWSDYMKNLMAAMGPMAKNMASMQEEMKKIKGFPLAQKTTVSVMGRKSVTTNEVTEIKNGPVPATAWDIPAGYTKIDNPMTKMMAKGK